MKKVALVFVLAVLAPSLVLAWLAVRSLRDQQFLLERQQSLLDQRVTDTLAQNISDYLAQQQQAFSAQVESLATAGDPRALAAKFDDQLRQHWPLAEVGFCVTAAGKILSPVPNSRTAAQMFRLDNSGFLGNREPVEVYFNANNPNNLNANASAGNSGPNSSLNFGRGQASQAPLVLNGPSANSTALMPTPPPQPSVSGEASGVLKLSTPRLQNLASAKAPVSTSGAENGPGQNVSPPAGTMANNGNANFYAGNVGANNRLNSSRNQGNQISFAINGSYANSAVTTQSAQRQQSGPVTHSALLDSSTSRPPPGNAAIAIATDGGGFGGGALTSLSGADSAAAGGGSDGVNRKWSTPPEMTRNPVSAEVISPVQPQAIPDVARAKPLTAPLAETDVTPQSTIALDDNVAQKDASSTLNYKAAQSRMVSPQSQMYQNLEKSAVDNSAEQVQNNLSKVVPAEAEFRQLIGDQTDGMLARFLQNKLKLMCWHRLSAQPDLIFGAQLNLDRVVDGLRGFVQPDRAWSDDLCLAVLDDNAKPVVFSRANFQANWKRPFVATEVGDALPHWEAAAYLVNPAQLTQAAQTTRLTLGLLVALLVIAIGIGSLLIVRSLGAELKLARQKTDFVGNVSHELKTPLTSIRMFSELLAEGRVADPAKQHSYLQIITAEAARLTRLINNVLDFSRMERGEKKYNFQPCDLTDLVRATAETFRPHLESAGFQFACELPAAPIPVRADADALSQIIVNLLSNAEKYSASPERRAPPRPDGESERRSPTRLDGIQAGLQTSPCPQEAPNTEPQRNAPSQDSAAPPKEILLHLSQKQSPLPYAEIKVWDRGPGVPRGCEEKVFEKFYRAHDSLSSGIQGSGLGLTIARQIARAHGGDVVYEPRDGGGSCFILRLPLSTTDELR